MEVLHLCSAVTYRRTMSAVITTQLRPVVMLTLLVIWWIYWEACHQKAAVSVIPAAEVRGYETKIHCETFVICYS